MMTRHDFELLADRLAESEPNKSDSRYPNVLHEGWDVALRAVMAACMDSNDRFNPKHFLERATRSTKGGQR